MQSVCIGKIVGFHGLKGHIKVKPYTDNLDRFFDFSYIYLDKELSNLKNISECKIHKNIVLILFENTKKIEDVQIYKDRDLYIDLDKQGYPLETDQFFITSLIGMEVIDQNNNNVGKIVDVLKLPSQDTIVVKYDSKEWYLPFVGRFVDRVDTQSKRLYVNLIEGFI